MRVSGGRGRGWSNEINTARESRSRVQRRVTPSRSCKFDDEGEKNIIKLCVEWKEFPHKYSSHHVGEENELCLKYLLYAQWMYLVGYPSYWMKRVWVVTNLPGCYMIIDERCWVEAIRFIRYRENNGHSQMNVSATTRGRDESVFEVPSLVVCSMCTHRISHTASLGSSALMFQGLGPICLWRMCSHSC